MNDISALVYFFAGSEKKRPHRDGEHGEKYQNGKRDRVVALIVLYKSDTSLVSRVTCSHDRRCRNEQG